MEPFLQYISPSLPTPICVTFQRRGAHVRLFFCFKSPPPLTFALFLTCAFGKPMKRYTEEAWLKNLFKVYLTACLNEHKKLQNVSEFCRELFVRKQRLHPPMALPSLYAVLFRSFTHYKHIFSVFYSQRLPPSCLCIGLLPPRELKLSRLFWLTPFWSQQQNLFI